jgi:hypothetical protein
MECPHPSIHPGEQRPTFPSESGALWPAEPHQASYVTDWTVQQADLVSPFKVVVQAARGRHPRKIRANPRGVIHKSPVYLTTLISGKKGAKNDVKGCPKRRLLHRVDHHESCCPSTHPLFHHFCRPKMASQRLTRPIFQRRLPMQHIAWTASTTNMDGLPTFCSPLPHCSTPIGHTTFSHKVLSII